MLVLLVTAQKTTQSSSEFPPRRLLPCTPPATSQIDGASGRAGQFHVNFANEHGFYVDINCPWRMVLNLKSPVAQENILNGRSVDKFEDFYSDTYVMKIGYDDFWALKSF